MQPKSEAQGLVSSICRLTATFVLLYLTFRLVGKPLAEWPKLIESLHISLRWLTAALILLLLTVLVNSGKWILTLKIPFRAPISSGRALYYYCTGYFFNSFITGSGDIKRAFDLGRESGRVSQAWASVMIDRWSGVIGQLALTFVSLQMAAQLIPALRFLSWLCALGIATLLIGFYLVASLPLHQRPTAKFWLTCWRLQRSFAEYKKRPLLIGICLLLSLVSPLLLIVAHFTLAQGLNISVSAQTLFYYIPAVSVFAQMPVTVNGFGLQDYCMVSVLQPQMDSVQALTLSVAFHIARLTTGAICGLIYSLFPNLGLADTLAKLEKDNWSIKSTSSETT